jgi:hypothetical protein
MREKMKKQKKRREPQTPGPIPLFTFPEGKRWPTPGVNNMALRK